MAYDPNDPRRMEHPTPPELVRGDPTGWIIGALAVIAIIGLVYAMLPPSTEQPAPRVTERIETPAKPVPPAAKPPAPAEPSQKPNPPTTPQ